VRGRLGLWRTLTANLERCRGHVEDHQLTDEERARVATRLHELLERIEAERKSRRWKLRAKIGERKRWYELPEEV
jgi:hypothetical protein